ncbi:4'-phosphopantetheinyl transferase superfamily protein [Caulobacter sp. 17J65-9]|uniref:4'-phosphopantetheinyl transferase superfamily protein n=1 Tax=Caulobacter sp. 17J65-9 TaxID=2709382 RepID=UPI0013CAF1EE|nr:4'-phosphopantetheinyl transferase superfamily protein [Caulobacter sp. 17J65-9]
MSAAVHAYWVDLDAMRGDLARFTDRLGRDEQERAERYRFDRDRRRFLLRRGVLRELLSRYVDVAPERLVFDHNDFGKPSLPHCDVRFNLSHSHGLALFAVARGREVGCDVERRDPRHASAEIAERWFPPAEARALHTLEPGGRLRRFFESWTLMEALGKARGVGLAEAAADGADADGQDWTTHPFEPAAAFQACVVAQGRCAVRVERLQLD